MAVVISVISQKGGVGKSTVARLIAREFAAHGWAVKIADLDISQGTSFKWRSRRLQHGLEPDVPVEMFGSVKKALEDGARYDLLVIDGAPHATEATKEAARGSQLVIIPTGLSVDDLEPTVLLAHELAKLIDRDRIVFTLSRVGSSSAEVDEGRVYLERSGYKVLVGELPDQVGYRRAIDEGRTVTETRFASLNQRADQVAQAIMDKLAALTG